MKKEKVFIRYFRYTGEPIRAKKEIPFHICLQARLILDAICFEYNRAKLMEAIDRALLENDRQNFLQLCDAYRQYMWE